MFERLKGKQMTQYNPIGSQQLKAITSPKQPGYATYKPTRNPAVKYQTRGDAKNALRWCIAEGSGFRSGLKNFTTITVYKFYVDGYVPIFDSNSELADALRNNLITEDELFNLIDW